ncbi:MAG: hypothetical protein HKP58_14440, partial [Desulfatitalea sp.]|nr:hypothetical protein [Desulfatitalea sp.]NNK01604.1 hypothetical protein [Desulfatitalea sp.]
MKPAIRKSIATAIFSLYITGMHAALTQADWRADVGYTRLAMELGDTMPGGMGLGVCQVEAVAPAGQVYTWMPDPANAAFAGNSLTDYSGAPAG